MFDAGEGGARFLIVNSTITNNTAGGEVGGIFGAEGAAIDPVYSDVIDDGGGSPDDLLCEVNPAVVPGSSGGSDVAPQEGTTTEPTADPNGPSDVRATQANAANVATGASPSRRSVP